jgi:hypothetical protein
VKIHSVRTNRSLYQSVHLKLPVASIADGIAIDLTCSKNSGFKKGIEVLRSDYEARAEVVQALRFRAEGPIEPGYRTFGSAQN